MHIDYTRAGIECYDNGEFEKAVECFTKELETNPDDDFVYFYRANSYDKLGEFDKAIADYTKAINLNPISFNYHSKGYCYLNNEKFEQAIPCFIDALKLEADFFTHHCLGDCYFELKNYNEAIENYEKALKLNKNYDISYLMLAKSFLKIGNEDQSIYNFAVYALFNDENKKIIFDLIIDNKTLSDKIEQMIEFASSLEKLQDCCDDDYALNLSKKYLASLEQVTSQIKKTVIRKLDMDSDEETNQETKISTRKLDL